MSALQKFMNTLELNFLFTVLRDTPMTTLYLEKCEKKKFTFSNVFGYYGLITYTLLKFGLYQ